MRDFSISISPCIIAKKMSENILLVYISLSIAAQHGYVGKTGVFGWVVVFINGVSKHSQEPP